MHTKRSVSGYSENTSSRSRRKLPYLLGVPASHFWLLVALLVLGTILRLYALDAKGLWGDEIWTAQRSSASLSVILSEYLDLPGPLYYLAGKVTLKLLPMLSSEAALRLPAALAGVASILLTYWLARRWISSAVGLVAALLMAVSPYQVWYAQEARFYTFNVFLFLSAVLALEYALERPRAWLPWVIWVLSTSANLYTQPLPAVLGIFAQALYGGIWLVRTKERQLIVSATAAGLSTILLYLPVLLKIVGQRLDHTAVQNTSWYFDRAGRGLLLGPAFELMPSQFLRVSTKLATSFAVPAPGHWLFLIVALAGIVGMIRQKHYAPLLMFLSCFSVVLFIFIVLRPANGLHVRYVLYLQPLYLILIAAGVFAIGAILQRRTGYLRVGAVSTQLALLVALSLAGVRQAYLEVKPVDWRAVSQYLAKATADGGMIIGNAYVPAALSWYGVPTSQVGIYSGTINWARTCARGGISSWYVSAQADGDHKRMAHYAGTMPLDAQAWTPRGMHITDFSTEEAFFPNSEWPVMIYPYIAPLTAEKQFCLVNNVPWSDRSYQHLSVGDQLQFALRLDNKQPRTLALTMYDLPGSELEVLANGISLGRIGSGSGWWATIPLVLPPEIASDKVEITLRAIGSQPGGVSAAALTYDD